MGVVEGRSVRLRPLGPSDLEPVFAWYTDPDLVAPFDRFSLESFDEFARSVADASGDPSSLAPRYAVERKAPGDLVGVLGHYRPHPVLEYVEVWYLIGSPAARGQGLGSEAVGLLVDELFRTETVERVGANCDVENAASVRLLERIGMRREGTLRSALFHHGRWHDVHLYGVTRPERSSAPRPA